MEKEIVSYEEFEALKEKVAQLEQLINGSGEKFIEALTNIISEKYRWSEVVTKE